MTFEETATNVLVKVEGEKACQLAILAKLVDPATKTSFENAALLPLHQVEQMVQGWNFNPPHGRGVPEALIGNALALLNASVAIREKLEKAIAKKGWNVQAHNF